MAAENGVFSELIMSVNEQSMASEQVAQHIGRSGKELVA
jgi:hypothetical protein